MLRSRIHPGTFKTHGALRSTRHKSTLEDLTQQSRVKPPGAESPHHVQVRSGKVFEDLAVDAGPR
jgi:hypothetical protein